MEEDRSKTLSHEEREKAKAEKAKKIKAEIIDYAKAILTAVIAVILIMTFIARSYYVEGASMEPNYHGGERIMVEKITYRFSHPKRGDVFVFKYPMDTSRRFIKRVIGVAGDTVYIKDGETFVNGVLINEPYIYDKSIADFGPVVVPEGRVFAMGDNRNNSHDSRSPSVGMIPYNLIDGKCLFRYWPINEIGACEHYREYPAEINNQ